MSLMLITQINLKTNKMITEAQKKEINKQKSEKFKKTPQERVELKEAKSLWKKLNPTKK